MEKFKGHYKIIHQIKLYEYEYLLSNITKIAKDYVAFNKNVEKELIFPHVQFLIDKINNKILNLKVKKPKNKRSINWIGSAWKWVAGSPDHQDMEIIENHINNTLINNNKQVIINSQFSNKINQIIKSFNDLIKKGGNIVDKIPENIILKLQYIDEELTNIAYAIHWAKNNIINPQLLGKEEMQAALIELDKNNFPYSNIEEAFNIATIKLASNENNILYIIDIPLVYYETYEILTLRANGLSNPIIDLPYNTILHNHEVYGIIKPCKMLNDILICQNEDIVDITDTLCIPNILKGTKATCNEVKKYSKQSIELLSEGILLLNSFIGNITQDCSDYIYNLNGTFVLKFNNCSVTVNGKTFISKIVLRNKKLPQTYITSWTSSNKNEWTVKEIKELHINNTDSIELINTQVKIHFMNTIFFYGIIIFTIIIFFYLKCKKKNTIEIINNMQPIEDIPMIQLSSSPAVQPIQENSKLSGKRT